MKYYLVALFDEESYGYMEEIQRSISKQYRLYNPNQLPTLHITLEVIDEPDLERLEELLLKILKPYKKFKAEVNGTLCFDAPYKSVNLKVENKGYIIRIARNINSTLKLAGFNVRENIDNWSLHVSIANPIFSSKNWSVREYTSACERVKAMSPYCLPKIDRIELWKPVNNKSRMVVKSFSLRDY